MINKQAIDRVYELSQICTIGSLVVLIPFLAYGIWSDSIRYPEPIPKIFHDVKFRVSGAARSPATIIVADSEGKMFFSDCNGLGTLVCSDEKYWKMWHSAKQIEAIEVGPRRGIIKSILMDTSRTISIDNTKVKAWLTDSNRTLWQGIYGLSIVFCLSITFLCISRQLRSTIFGEE
ncbi:hypothetical protein [Sterolibacterium denitrificans]|uniref:hypothetical protein n=1 Tax=Sterolibacterium denitrificans TaxID=157592 RepID=UPI0012B68090|nr:hypothetical protein [Sterolibacterium denitrificans]